MLDFGLTAGLTVDNRSDDSSAQLKIYQHLIQCISQLDQQ